MNEHGHTHEHCHCHEATAQETLTLLEYMLDHNRHHADELHETAHGLDGEAKTLVHAAVIDIESSNDKLAKAIALLKKTEE